LDEFNGLARCQGCDRLYLDPFREFVDSHEDMSVPALCFFEGADHVQPPACEGPRHRDYLEFLSREVCLLGEELALLASADQIDCILLRGWPIESSSESFADQGS